MSARARRLIAEGKVEADEHPPPRRALAGEEAREPACRRATGREVALGALIPGDADPDRVLGGRARRRLVAG